MKITNLNKKIFGILIAMGLAVPAFASVGVSPTKIEINANKVKTNYITTAIEVKGDAHQPMRFKAYTEYFTINELSEVVMKEKSNDVHDISKKVRFVPSEFTVAPGKSQKLRINIAGLNTLADGENRAILYIEDVNPKEMNLPTGQSGIGAQLIVKTRIGVPIYVDKGKFIKKGEVEYFNVSQEKGNYYLNYKVLSQGNSKIRYNASVQITQGKKLIDEYSLSGKAVGENNYYIAKEKLHVDKIPNNGEYTVRLIVSYTNENGKRINLKNETNVNIQGEV